MYCWYQQTCNKEQPSDTERETHSKFALSNRRSLPAAFSLVCSDFRDLLDGWRDYYYCRYPVFQCCAFIYRFTDFCFFVQWAVTVYTETVENKVCWNEIHANVVFDKVWIHKPWNIWSMNSIIYCRINFFCTNT